MWPMLSGESAMGRYPLDAVAMLSRIAATMEPHRSVFSVKQVFQTRGNEDRIMIHDLIASSVETTLNRITPTTVVVPTHSGDTARSIARFKLPVWVTASFRCMNPITRTTGVPGPATGLPARRFPVTVSF